MLLSLCSALTSVVECSKAIKTGLRKLPLSDDLAMVSQAIERRGRHLGVAEHAGPFTEGKFAKSIRVNATTLPRRTVYGFSSSLPPIINVSETLIE
jgi:hypothetical protein